MAAMAFPPHSEARQHPVGKMRRVEKPDKAVPPVPRGRSRTETFDRGSLQDRNGCNEKIRNTSRAD